MDSARCHGRDERNCSDSITGSKRRVGVSDVCRGMGREIEFIAKYQ